MNTRVATLRRIDVHPPLAKIKRPPCGLTPLQERWPLRIRWRTVQSLTRTVRHRSPMRLRHRCACNRLAAAALKRATSGGSSLGNAFPPVVTASLIQGRPGGSPPWPKAPRRLALHGRGRLAPVRSVCIHKGFRLRTGLHRGFAPVKGGRLLLHASITSLSATMWQRLYRENSAGGGSQPKTERPP